MREMLEQIIEKDNLSERMLILLTMMVQYIEDGQRRLEKHENKYEHRLSADDVPYLGEWAL